MHPIFRILEMEIDCSKYNKYELAEILGISNSSFLRKRTGETEFKMSEMFKLKELLEFDEPLEVLFSVE